ncbi:ParB/RepB/Spo0J family partition protein [Ideonella paludis]|uniref:ParB/RepB/Spo0J family partition protein n=1 Tax=Ideonella paludis TaxID=1233411 RepID=A0ABS5DU15_9BURK|nr:ParB/RepB/Spo0J family partition protein [Ideonella paludis]MBQ0934622.1 ParB/RepB/Spo0J family partition protein [Ideonella paludis]
MSQTPQIRVDHIHESPFNPRRVFNETRLQELATDIKQLGVLQPVLVRPRIPELFHGIDDENAVAGYELVFGHRRYRAAVLAGLETMPAMVQSLTDEQVKRMQLSENLQRDDVHPIEEAEGFQALMAEHGLSADDLVAETGKSRSYIYGRLKLLQACKEVRDACLAGEIGSETALLVARIPTEKLQGKALARIKAKNMDMGDGGKKSYRDIQWLLREEFTLNLTAKDCIFPFADPDLLPSAGACTTCPKRTENAPEYQDMVQDSARRWGGVVKGDAWLCTDPDCYQAKKTAHLKAEAQKLAAKGEVVIEGNKARAAVSARGVVTGAYVALADVKAELAKAKQEAAKQATSAPTVVTIQDPRTGKLFKAVKEAELIGLGVRQATPKQQREHDDWKARQARDAAERQKKEEKAERLTEAQYELLLRTRAVMHTQPRDHIDLAMVCHAALCGVGHWDKGTLTKLWGHDDYTDLQKSVGSMPVQDLTKLLMDCALVKHVRANPWTNEQPTELLSAAKRYGVPIETPKPSEPLPPAARALDKGAAKANPRAVAYRCPDSGQAWSGRGLKPKWLQVALANGKTLADFAVQKTDGPAALAPVGADGDGQAAAQGNTDPVLGSAEQGLIEGTDAQGVDAGATAEA